MLPNFGKREHQKDVLRLMQLADLQQSAAQQLYKNSGKNLQKAVQMHYNKGKQMTEDSNPSTVAKSNNSIISDNLDDLYERYVALKKSGRTFSDNYEVRRENGGGLTNLVSSFLWKTLQQQNPFKKRLEEYVGKLVPIKFCNKNVSQAVQQFCLKQKFPMVIHLINFHATSKKQISTIYQHKELISLLNNQFKNYGIDPNDYSLQPDLKSSINTLDADHFSIIRVNALEEVQVLDKIYLAGATPRNLIEKLKQIKNICINKEMDEAQVQRKFQQEHLGNFNHQRPRVAIKVNEVKVDKNPGTSSKRTKVQSIEKSKKKENSKLEKKSTRKKSVKSNFKLEKQYSKEAKSPRKSVREEREEMRKKLKIYDKGILIRLNPPSNKDFKFMVDPKEKVKYLYDFVISKERNLGFKNEKHRNFDLLQPLNQINLSNHMKQTIEKALGKEKMIYLVAREK